MRGYARTITKDEEGGYLLEELMKGEKEPQEGKNIEEVLASSEFMQRAMAILAKNNEFKRILAVEMKYKSDIWARLDFGEIAKDLKYMPTATTAVVGLGESKDQD